MNPKVDAYFIDGCGRCEFYATSKCKVKKWSEILHLLRSFIRDSELTEELKWSQPCYTFKNKNVLILTAFKEYCAISFLKGVLLKDKKKLLHKPGENSQSVRFLKFSHVDDVLKLKNDIKSYIEEAIQIEKNGLKVDNINKPNIVVPEELENLMNDLPEFKKAFFSLTPGRQRGYLIYFSAPKQSKTRLARILKYKPQILNGKGINDDYRGK